MVATSARESPRVDSRDRGGEAQSRVNNLDWCTGDRDCRRERCRSRNFGKGERFCNLIRVSALDYSP